MQLKTRIPKRRAPRPAPPEPLPLTPEAAETRAARRGGGPEDHALYACACGYVFTAQVSTSVDCPHCGSEQAW